MLAIPGPGRRPALRFVYDLLRVHAACPPSAPPQAAPSTSLTALVGTTSSCCTAWCCQMAQVCPAALPGMLHLLGDESMPTSLPDRCTPGLVHTRDSIDCWPLQCCAAACPAGPPPTVCLLTSAVTAPPRSRSVVVLLAAVILNIHAEEACQLHWQPWSLSQQLQL